MNKRLLDTDVLIEFFRQNKAVVSRVAAYLQDHDQLSIAIVTYYEVLRGLRYVNVEQRFTRHIRALRPATRTQNSSTASLRTRPK